LPITSSATGTAGSWSVIEAKRSSINSADAEAQGRNYARQLGVPFVSLTNRTEVRFGDWELGVFPRPVKTFFGQEDVIRRAARPVRTDERDSWVTTNLASHIEVG